MNAEGGPLGIRRRVNGSDLALGVLALSASAGYLYETVRIPESLLEDSVGARGVPLAIGWAMVALGAILCLRSFLRGGVGADVSSASSEPFAAVLLPHVQALRLFAILATYVVLLPRMGYILSTALLIAAVAWFSGAAKSRYLPVIAIAGGAFLWLMFDPLLGISLPTGSWWEGR